MPAKRAAKGTRQKQAIHGVPTRTPDAIVPVSRPVTRLTSQSTEIAHLQNINTELQTRNYELLENLKISSKRVHAIKAENKALLERISKSQASTTRPDKLIPLSLRRVPSIKGPVTTTWLATQAASVAARTRSQTAALHELAGPNRQFPSSTKSPIINSQISETASLSEQQTSNSDMPGSKTTNRTNASGMTMEKCFDRKISVTPSDSWQGNLKTTSLTSMPKMSKDQQKEYLDAWKFLLKAAKAAPESPNDTSHDRLKALMEVCDIKGYKPVVTKARFKSDRARCKSPTTNEFVLQHTLMMHVMDHPCFDFFNWTCESRWVSKIALPSTGEEAAPSPRSDYSVSFSLAAIAGKKGYKSYPPDLRYHLHPDKSATRCFPFLFIEVKRREDDLSGAYLSNLHAASLGLWNIWKWMDKAGYGDEFKNIRVFSLALNASHMYLREHRAIPIRTNLAPTVASTIDSSSHTNANGKRNKIQTLDENQSKKSKKPKKVFLFKFEFAEIKEVLGYTREQACALVKNVLLGDVTQKLLPELKKTYKKVAKDYEILRDPTLAGEQASSTQSSRKVSRLVAESIASSSQSNHTSTDHDYADEAGTSPRIITSFDQSQMMGSAVAAS